VELVAGLKSPLIPLFELFAEFNIAFIFPIRHIVMGRKNFAGSKTVNGADVAATLYTVIETSKKVGLQPKDYLKYLITERWHGRTPQTPLERSLALLGENKRVIFPAKHEWEIR
jgi:hypothetical protein